MEQPECETRTGRRARGARDIDNHGGAQRVSYRSEPSGALRALEGLEGAADAYAKEAIRVVCASPGSWARPARTRTHPRHSRAQYTRFVVSGRTRLRRCTDSEGPLTGRRAPRGGTLLAYDVNHGENVTCTTSVLTVVSPGSPSFCPQ